MNAATLLALDPAGLGGAVLAGPPDPARDMWLDGFRMLLPPAAPFRRVPAHVDADRLLGGLDLAATLAAGRPVAQRGVLAEAHGGAVLLPGAERLSPAHATSIAACLDAGEVCTERDGISHRAPVRLAVIALDEGAAAEEAVPPALQERLAFWLDPREVDDAEPIDLAPARLRLARVTVPDSVIEALCATAAALGIVSLRAPLLAVRAARAAAALAGHDEVGEEEAAMAARLVLAPRATALPAPAPEPSPADAPEPTGDVGEMAERVLEAARTALPPGLLASLAAGSAGRSTSAGRAGAVGRSGRRGRPAGVRPGDPRRGQRLALLATIRSAVPWQRLRGRTERLEIRATDLRVERRRPRTPTTTIFLVDASGSQAMGRLAEAKGAVQLLLADCYVRRDEVALIAFRGPAAELLLPPTRSLARARRCLAGLPGGGGTPLAAGLDAGCALADGVRRRGGTASLVLLTDGSANIGRNGRPGRAAAEHDALDAGRRIRAAGHRALLVDSALRPVPQASRLADSMGARYVKLPFAAAQVLSELARGG